MTIPSSSVGFGPDGHMYCTCCMYVRMEHVAVASLVGTPPNN